MLTSPARALALLIVAVATCTAEREVRPKPTRTTGTVDTASPASERCASRREEGSDLQLGQWHGQDDDFEAHAQPSACAAVVDDFANIAVKHDQQQQHLLHARQDPEPSQPPRIPQDAPVGGLSMTQPPATPQATFHKIADGNFITFGWSFSDVIVQPQTLMLQAYCSQNGYTYPVGPTQGIAGDSTQFAWNPYDYDRSAGATPLAEASYTLRIFDERGYGAAATAGYMRSYAGTVFALYRPQKYVGLAEGWECAACSAALRSMPIHPAVVATALSVFAGFWLVLARMH